MTTQPLEWKPPSTAKIYELQPLKQEQIEQFLFSRQRRLPKDAKIQGANYEQAYTHYLAEILKKQQSQDEDLKEVAAFQRILSNPMDLTLVALILSQGEQPNLFHLQKQQYNLMAEEYQQERMQEFPLKKFSEAVYQMRLDDTQALPTDEFSKELGSSRLITASRRSVPTKNWEEPK